MVENLVNRLRSLAGMLPQKHTLPSGADTVICSLEAFMQIKELAEDVANVLEGLSKPRWIPVTARPMDEEERKEWSEKLGYDIEYNEALVYTSQLPDDGQEVLTFSKYGGIRIDKFVDDPDYGCFFEDNGDMDGIVAWMPLPLPPEQPKDETPAGPYDLLYEEGGYNSNGV